MTTKQPVMIKLEGVRGAGSSFAPSARSEPTEPIFSKATAAELGADLVSCLTRLAATGGTIQELDGMLAAAPGRIRLTAKMELLRAVGVESSSS